MVRFPGRTDQSPTQASLRYVEEGGESTARRKDHRALRPCQIGDGSRRPNRDGSNLGPSAYNKLFGSLTGPSKPIGVPGGRGRAQAQGAWQFKTHYLRILIRSTE